MAEGGHRALARQLQHELTRAQAKIVDLEAALAKALVLLDTEWSRTPATSPDPAPRARKVTHKVRAR